MLCCEPNICKKHDCEQTPLNKYCRDHTCLVPICYNKRVSYNYCANHEGYIV